MEDFIRGKYALYKVFFYFAVPIALITYIASSVVGIMIIKDELSLYALLFIGLMGIINVLIAIIVIRSAKKSHKVWMVLATIVAVVWIFRWTIGTLGSIDKITTTRNEIIKLQKTSNNHHEQLLFIQGIF